MENMVALDLIIPAASEYQEIHPHSAMDIDIVKINISQIMMREWLVLRVGGEGGEGGVNGSNLAALQASNHGHTTTTDPTNR